ncbi:FecR family protein [Methylomonas sp. AM2-LC]|uniref:FecR family protein n=1 Tax=Methylomonas sp. AM2-LC TaxID=3153301 RepID=UPI003264D7EB
MPNNESNALMRERLEQEAVSWYARMASGDMTTEEQAAFDKWRQLSPAHEKASRKMAKLWDMLELALPVAEHVNQQIDAHDTEIVSEFSQAIGFSEQSPHGSANIISLDAARQKAANAAFVESKRQHKKSSPYATVARWGLGLASVASLLLFICFSHCADYLHHPLADYRTLIGEQTTLHLADGSSVYLNTDTALDVILTDKERRIVLLQGEAEFEVAHDSSRPFRVISGTTTTEALGTRFVVRYDDKAGTITLLEGKVSATQTTAAGEFINNVNLRPGERVAFNEHSLGDVQIADLSTADAWRRGRLVMNFVSLQDVVAEINRYRRGRVQLLNADLAYRAIHVTIDTKHIDDWLDALEDTLPVRVRHLGPFVLLESR